MNIFITNYINPELHLPPVLLFSSAHKAITMIEENHEFFKQNPDAKSYYIQLTISYLKEYEKQFAKTRMLPIAEKLALQYPPTRTITTTLPPLTFAASKLHQQDKKHYIITCRQEVIRRTYNEEQACWKKQPPQWLTKQQPLLDLGLGSFEVKP